MLRYLTVFVFVNFVSADVTYPCGRNATFNCAAAYFAEIGGCESPPEGDIGDFEYPHQIEAPFFKGTIYKYESTYCGIGDATITEFFTDTDCGRTIMSVTFPSIKNFGREIIEYHSPSTCRTEVDTAFLIHFNSVCVTFEWDGIDCIKTNTARIYTETGSTEYDVQADWPELAAEIANNPDGSAAKTARMAAQNREILNCEEALYVGRAVAGLFWNSRICSNLPCY